MRVAPQNCPQNGQASSNIVFTQNTCITMTAKIQRTLKGAVLNNVTFGLLAKLALEVSDLQINSS